MMNFVLETRKFVFTTRNCVSKPRNFLFKTMDFADFTTSMLVMAVILETVGLVVFGVVIGSMTTYISTGKQDQVSFQQNRTRISY